MKTEINNENDDRELRFYAPFALPDEPRFTDVGLKCRQVLQLIRSFHGTRWEDLIPKRKFKNQEPESSLLAEIEIPWSLPRKAKSQLRRAATVHDVFWNLAGDAVRSNDAHAASTLVRAVTLGVEVLIQARAQNPEIFSSILKNSIRWPVLIRPGPEGLAGVEMEIAGLGEDLLRAEGLKSVALERWQQLPARKWAMAIRAILGWNRVLAIAVVQSSIVWPKLKKHLHWKGFIFNEKIPKWFQRCGSLPDFSRKTVPQWMALGKEMIKDQMPDFDKKEEWRNWDLRAASRTKPGTSPRSKKRNDIFDSIQAAMETIAMNDELPESASRKTVIDKL